MSPRLGAPSLAGEHDCLLLDLDGTVYRGFTPIAGAVETLESVRLRTLFLTNNASRTAAEVANHMSEMGFAIDPTDVVTSAHTAARLLRDQVPCGSKVLVIGTEALAAEVADAGLVPVRSCDDAPIAVVQGYSPHTNWAALAEGALAIRAGALWLASNIDLTLPTERGLVPGNGSMVVALCAATGSEPIVAGKPQPHMLRDALARGNFRAPLVIGDRLDTDIAGATAAGLPSMLVLSGVSTATDLIYAKSEWRPTYIAEDLRALTQPSDVLRVGPQRGWHADIGRGAVIITSTSDDAEDLGLSVVRATVHAIWCAEFVDCQPLILGGDDPACRALEKWCLLD